GPRPVPARDGIADLAAAVRRVELDRRARLSVVVGGAGTVADRARLLAGADEVHRIAHVLDRMAGQRVALVARDADVLVLLRDGRLEGRGRVAVHALRLHRPGDR